MNEKNPGTSINQAEREPVIVTKRIWRERRGEGWSETTYSGLYFEIEGQPVLVSKLSHGLRVIPITDSSRYQFQESEAVQPVEVSVSFIEHAKLALAADAEFQKQIDVYEKAIS